MTHQYTIASTPTGKSVAFMADGQLKVANQDHKFFDQILAAVDDDSVPAQTILGLFDLKIGLTDRFERIGRRVTVQGGTLYFDGEPLDTALADVIVKSYTDGNDDFTRLVLFLEKLAANPNQEAVKTLYPWLAHLSFSIDEDGDIIAYKGVSSSDEDGLFYSCSSGNAISDGVAYVSARIPQRLGSVVEMPRTQVTFDPSRACSQGLHVGTHGYAVDYGDTLIRVKINPTDVVSVPTDSYNQKLRTCRYTVVEINAQEQDNLFEATLPEGTTYEDEVGAVTPDVDPRDLDTTDSGDDYLEDDSWDPEWDDDDDDEEFTDEEEDDILAAAAEADEEFGEDDEDSRYAARLAEVLNLNRDDVRVLAASYGIARRDQPVSVGVPGRDRTKRDLAKLIVDLEFNKAA